MPTNARFTAMRLLIALALCSLLTVCFRVAVDATAYFARVPPYRGSAVHRARTAAFIAELSRETYQESVERLVESAQFMDEQSRTSEVKGAQRLFRISVSSRRGMKVLAAIDECDEETARKKARELFTNEFSRLRDTIDRVLRHYEDPTAPENTESMFGDQAALALALFSVAHFVVLLISWSASTPSTLTRIRRRPESMQASCRSCWS